MSLQTRLEAWVAAVGADMKERITLTTAQVVTGTKTFASGTLLMRNAAGTVTAEPYSDVNAPESLNRTTRGTTPSTPAVNTTTEWTPDGKALYIIASDGVTTRLGPSADSIPFSRTGALTVLVGTIRFPIPYACLIESIVAIVGTAPTGASLILDVNKNGTTIYGTQANRPTIAVSTNTAVVGAHSITTATTGDYLTVDVDQIGSTVAGSDLTLSVTLRRTG